MSVRVPLPEGVNLPQILLTLEAAGYSGISYLIEGSDGQSEIEISGRVPGGSEIGGRSRQAIRALVAGATAVPEAEARRNAASARLSALSGLLAAGGMPSQKEREQAVYDLILVLVSGPG